MAKALRVCYFGTYRSEYARNQVLIEGLRRAGAEVLICHEPLWHSIEDRIQVASGGWYRPGFWLRVFRTYRRLIRKYRTISSYDILVVGYPGQYDVFLARLLCWFSKKPLVWDVLNSMYLIMTERGIAQAHRLTAGIVRRLEQAALRLPDLLFLDTDVFIEWFHTTYRISANHFRVIPICIDKDELPDALRKAGDQAAKDPQQLSILYYGTFIPNHGVDVIIEAAHLLRDDPEITFCLVGDGPDKQKALELAESYNLKNVDFIDWLEKPALALKITIADICLGGFGDTLQASLTFNNKVYEAFSLKKPVITGKSPAIPPSLIHGEHLYLCERGSPASLAESIRTLRDDPTLRSSLGDNGYAILTNQFDLLPIGKLFYTCLAALARP